MRGHTAVGVCALLAGIVAILQSRDGLRQRRSQAPRIAGSTEDNDIMFMLQAKPALQLRTRASEGTSANLAKTRTAMQSPAVSAESDIVTAAGSGGGQQHPVEPSYTGHDTPMDLFSKEGWVSLAVFLAVGGVYVAAVFIIQYWVNSVAVWDQREATARKFSHLNSSSEHPDETSPPGDTCMSLPMSALRQENARSGDRYGDSKVVIRDSRGDARLHASISTIRDATRLDVSTPQGKPVGQSVTIAPPANASSANARSFEINAQSGSLLGKYLDLHATGHSFKGTLEEQGSNSYTVLKDQQVIMYLRVPHNTNLVTVTSSRGKLLASANAKDDLEIHLYESDDAIIVLACVLAVVIRLFV